MSQWKSRVIGATLGAIAAMGIGGAGLAFAQTADDSTTTTETPAPTPAPAAPGARDGDDCPDKAGRGGAPGASPSDSSTAEGDTSAGEV
jgi:hypothetical protein